MTTLDQIVRTARRELRSCFFTKTERAMAEAEPGCPRRSGAS